MFWSALINTPLWLFFKNIFPHWIDFKTTESSQNIKVWANVQMTWIKTNPLKGLSWTSWCCFIRGMNTTSASRSVWKTGCPWEWERGRLWQQRVSGAYDWGDRTRQQTFLCIYSENICVSSQCFSPLLAQNTTRQWLHRDHTLNAAWYASPPAVFSLLDFPQNFLCVTRRLWLDLCLLWLVQTICCVAWV